MISLLLLLLWHTEITLLSLGNFVVVAFIVNLIFNGFLAALVLHAIGELKKRGDK
jgi:hypothetical protein